jgi:dTMP kinase
MAFIVFEGLDGSGKTTLMQKLSRVLDQRQVGHILTREPGGTVLGDELRQVLLRVDGDHPTPRCEILLYEAIRAQHVDRKIAPALKEKKWVLCDRYTASSLAFQGGGRKLKDKDIVWLNQFATTNLKPDLFVLLDLSVEESEKRRSHRQESLNIEADRFEREEKAFHKRIRKSYLDQAKKNKANWLVLDASQNPEKLFEELTQKLKKKKWLK